MSRMDHSQAVATWRAAAAVCMDVDSTVCRDEAIDKLAAYCGAGSQVADWTVRAMGGCVDFHTALKARLDLIHPSRAQLEALRAQPPLFTPGILELVAALHARGTLVYLVSGGFEALLEPVAAALSIPADRVFANKLLFDESGAYTGFDDSCPTAHSGGKAKVVAHVKTLVSGPVVMLGDGATDMEARPPADLFIGFGGNVVRQAVRDGADWFVSSMTELQRALE
eukprot:m.100309 g.100309  ORF g.100309 m.100309 type:complete len:225 (+) comp14055_c0_seq1:83-757(+)